MAKIIENIQLDEKFFLLRLEQGGEARPGQFYMLSPRDGSLLLPRPVSVFDQEEDSTTFLIASVGKGTEDFSRVKVGEEIQMEGPYGNGFPSPDGKTTYLIGGGTGIAPFFHMLKYWKKENFKVALGLRDKMPVLEKFFFTYCPESYFVYGGYVTDHIDLKGIDQVYTCGPKVMMEKVYNMAREIPVFMSLEKRMGCGFGACLACSCQTKEGRKTTCKDGPVFRGEDLL